MTPYYDDGSCTIYHGDCRDILPALAADVVITDPPYGTDHYVTDTHVLTPDLLGQLTTIGPTAIFGWPERLIGLCVGAGMVPSEWVTWWASNAATKAPCLAGTILPREAECIAVFGSGNWRTLRRRRTGTDGFQFNIARATDNCIGGFTKRSLTDDARLGDVWTDPSPGVGFNSHQRQHPNEKPVAVLSRLVESLSQPGQTVLDPFMGSGTTLRAAKNLGRKAIGIELEERYCEAAVKRLAQGVLTYG